MRLQGVWVWGEENNGEERHVEASLAILMTLASLI